MQAQELLHPSIVKSFKPFSASNLIVLPMGDKLFSELTQSSLRINSRKSEAKGEVAIRLSGNNPAEDSLTDSGEQRIEKPDKKRRRGKNKKTFTRRLWDKAEDEAIIRLVRRHGTRKWALISRKLKEKYHLYERSGKQCRER
eukprot:TRINITY_DN12956_c0_g1_i3.p3 TRINITY_DN12956_c0_g1~~TRINITY_DN12956_c0_g1_i3.p3  ORF type:complete len:142 (+),score=22.15 TRINITY_DN12956_c0_g1_i3:180-605(+)